MSTWYKGIGLWQPPEKWFRRHKRSKVYAVRVLVEPARALDAAWSALRSTMSTEDGFILDGGSSLERVTDDVVEVVSGGEDGLESLEYSINATLGEAVLAADPDARLSVIDERRVKKA